MGMKVSTFLPFTTIFVRVFGITLIVFCFIFSTAMAAIQGPGYFLAMPTVRSRPEWFLPVHPDLTQIILANLKSTRPSPSPLRAFPMCGRDLDSDGIHLNGSSGIPYVQFLVDQPRYFLVTFYCIHKFSEDFIVFLIIYT